MAGKRRRNSNSSNSSGGKRRGNIDLSKKDKKELAELSAKNYDRSKKIQFGLAYIVWALAPLITLDYWRIFKTGKFKNPLYYFLVLPAVIPVKIGGILHNLGQKIPYIGPILVFPFTAILYLFAPITEISGYTKEEFTHKGIEYTKDIAAERAGSKLQAKVGKKGVEKASESGSGVLIKGLMKKLPTKYWDDIVSIASIPTGIGPIIMTIIDIPFSVAPYKAMELLGWDEKLVRRHPKIGGFFVTAFLPKKYDENGNVLEDFGHKGNSNKETGGAGYTGSDPNKWQENGKTVMADGGRDRNNRRDRRASRDWNDLDAPEDDSSFNMPFSISPARIVGAIVGVGMLLGIGFVGTAVASGGGGPAAVAGDYLGANVDAPEFDGITFMVDKAVKTVSCFGDEGCIREWQLNNTRRPGSEDVGETYKLNIKNFQVYGSGGNADVAYSSPEDSIPIYFLVQNARNGLKGIDAKNVKYKVKVRDEGLLSSTNYCETDWLDLKTNFGSDSGENVLIPGAASEPLGWQNQLTLKECGMLQPGPGNYVNFVLEVKYDYSSQSTLYVDAMSQKHRRSQQIPIDFKRSETADTPVETFIETRSPLMFSENGNERTSIPFTTRVGVHTDSRDIEYKIKPSEFTFRDSSITKDVSDSCEDLNNSENNDYSLSGDIKDEIKDRQSEDNWFSSESPPPPASCTMKLSNNAEGVSRTGETLTMSADVEYTVKLEERKESFKLQNSRCATDNCPMLVPLKGNDISKRVVDAELSGKNSEYSKNEDYWTKEYATCSGNQDAQDGCSVIEGFEPDQRTPDPDVTIDEGDIAVDLSTAPRGLIHCKSQDFKEIRSVSPFDLEEVVKNQNRVFNKTGGDLNVVSECKTS